MTSVPSSLAHSKLKEVSVYTFFGYKEGHLHSVYGSIDAMFCALEKICWISLKVDYVYLIDI